MTLVEFLTARLDEDEQVALCSGDGRALAEADHAQRDVESKRRVVDLHGAGPHECVAWDEALGTTCTCYEVDCPTLGLLALPYAGHPDYRQEWAAN